MVSPYSSYNTAATGLKGALHRAGGMFQRAITTTGYGSTSAKAIEINFRPLLPLIATTSALIYHQGQQTAQPDGGEKNAWARILAEGGLGCLVLNHTAGIYPLFGICLAAYRAGYQTNAMDKIKVTVSTAVNLLMGYVGVNIFRGMSQMDQELDDQIIQRIINDHDALGRKRTDTNVSKWLEQLKEHSPESQVLGTLFENLKQHLNKLYPPVRHDQKPQKVSPEVQQELFENVFNAKTQIAEKFGQLGEHTLQGLNEEGTRAVKKMMNAIHYSQNGFTGLSRAMNPVFGYILMGLILGNPIANWINSSIDKKNPRLKEKKFNAPLFSQSNRVITNKNPVDQQRSASMKAALANSPYGNAQIIWPGVNGDKPLR